MSDLLLIGGFWQCYCVEIEKKNLRNREDEFHEQKMNLKRRKSKQTTIYPGVWGKHCDCACVGRGCLSARAELWGIVSRNLKRNQQVALSNWCNMLLKKLLKRKQHTYSLPDSLQPPQSLTINWVVFWKRLEDMFIQSLNYPSQRCRLFKSVSELRGAFAKSRQNNCSTRLKAFKRPTPGLSQQSV